MRKTYNMNFNWQFHDGEVPFNTHHDPMAKSGNCPIARANYSDENIIWETVQVPHDLRHHRCEFKNDEALMNEGYITTGIGWYRKEFFVSENQEGESFSVEFDGVFRNSEVYVNGHFVGIHLSGYTSFDYDVTDFIHCGKNNVIAVRADGSQFEGWWYEAVGIYRDVRLVVTDTLRIKNNGIYASYKISDNDAIVNVDVELLNLGNRHGSFSCKFDLYSPAGEKISTETKTITVDSYENLNVSQSFNVENIIRWDLDNSSQYTVEVTLLDSENILDSTTQKFGMREIEINADTGMFLNGKNIKVQGVCVHDDFAGVGGAMSRSVIRHKIHLLKQLGVTGYRCSHNPPSPYVLEACDDYGILVMDEVRLMSSSNEYLQQMTDLIKRDRNHPCVFIWSIGNEEMALHGTETGIKIIHHMLRVAKKLDTTRPYTYANNAHWYNLTTFHEEHGLSMELFGFNYSCLRTFDMYEKLHEKYPDRAIVSTEIAGTVVTRGQYLQRSEEQDDNYFSEKADPIMVWANEDRRKNTSEYGETYPKWSMTPMETLTITDQPYVIGYFIWTGFDYRGEVVPFQYPSVISRFGITDLCGFTKDVGHHFRVKWASEPAIHIYPHWTFEPDVGKLQVDIAANTDEVELIVNGVSLGRQKNSQREIVTNFVDYMPGEITAIGYNNSKKVIDMTRQTTYEPVEVNLEILQDRDYIANGEDNIFVKVELLDKNKNHCPTADNLVKFEVSGAGEFLGCGNGDPLSHDDDKLPKRNLFNGLALAILRTKRESGKITLTARCNGLKSKTIEIDVNVKASDVLLPTSVADLEIIQRDVDDCEKYL